jgi:hypothetical protein
VELRRALDHDRLDASLFERDRRRETADPCSDDNRSHAASLRRTTAHEALWKVRRRRVGSSHGERSRGHQCFGLRTAKFRPWKQPWHQRRHGVSK